MKLLILGGTVFVGRHLAQTALARGHTVTLFNRGKHNADLFPAAEKLRGDRNGNLEALKGRQWDAVIDTCGYVPRIVRMSAEALAESVTHYTFISTMSVYPDFMAPGLDEDAPVATMPEGTDATSEEVTGGAYGPLKALCEQAVEQAMPGRVLTVRPGLIVGPDDPTDRFTYWPQRMARGGEVLAPERRDLEVQFTDVRDLAEWIIRMIEAGRTGVFNANGPQSALTMGQLLEACRTATDSGARLTWVDEKFLAEAGVQYWTDLPLWLPGHQRVNSQKAIQAGLTFRPLAETIRDTLAWDAARADGSRHFALPPDREREILLKWHKQG
jgi:2'-hydroxyisoflavone reductase